GITSSTFDVFPGASDHLVFATQPTTTVAGQTIATVIVLVEDQNGNLVSNDRSGVTISIANNPAKGTLNGTTTMAAVGGVATFNNLSINTAGVGYTLRGGDASLTGVISTNFSITTIAHHL